MVNNMKDEKNLATSDSMSRMFALSRFDDFFTEIHDNFWKRFDELFEKWDLDKHAFEQLQPKATFPKVNVVDNPENYEIDIATAGFSKNDVELELKDNALLIKAEKTKNGEPGEYKSYLCREISKRSFRRVINFPAEINPDDVSAKYENGIISITIGKVIEDKPESIKIDIK